MAAVTAQVLIDDALVQLGVQKAGTTLAGDDAAFALRILNRTIGRLSAKHGVSQYGTIATSQGLSDPQEAMVFWAAVVALAPSYGLDANDYAQLARNAEQAALKDISASPDVSSDSIGGPPYSRFNILRRTSE